MNFFDKKERPCLEMIKRSLCPDLSWQKTEEVYKTEEERRRQAKKIAKLFLQVDVQKENLTAVRFLTEIILRFSGAKTFFDLADKDKQKKKRLFVFYPKKAGAPPQGMARVDFLVDTLSSMPFDTTVKEFYVPLAGNRKLVYPISLNNLKTLDPSALGEDLLLLQTQQLLAKPFYEKFAKAAKEKTRDKRNFDQVEGAKTRLQEKQFKPAYVPKAKEISPKYHTLKNPASALFIPTAPEEAKGCLKRKYILLIPADKEKKKNIEKDHQKHVEDFRQEAKALCQRRWSGLVLPSLISELMMKQKKNKGANANYIYSVHHKKPMFWGGTNKTRVFMDTSLHVHIHEDVDFTIGQINKCLELYDGPDLKDWKNVRAFLRKRPKVVEQLKKIPHIKIRDGLIAVGILWPKGKFCIPQLMQYEKIFGSPEQQKAKKMMARFVRPSGLRGRRVARKDCPAPRS